MDKKVIRNYILFTIFCLIFSLIYEMFSFQVYSFSMIFAFTIPLLFGVILLLILKNKNIFNNLSFKLYNSFILTLTIGLYINGVLEIYGTTNELINIYFIISLIFLISSFAIIVLKKSQIKKISM